MPSFPGVDYMEFDSLLSNEEKLVRQSVRQFADHAVIPVIEKCASESRFPMELVPQMAELGHLGPQPEPRCVA
jgi:glutaryl-CoA dehydrogenase